MSSDPREVSLPYSSHADQLTIQTPEQTEVDFAVAGIGSRFLALAYDTLIQMGIGLVVGIAGAFGIRGVVLYFPGVGIWAGAIFIIFYFLLYFGYYPFFEILWNGQTPGKRKAGIRVIKDSGRPLTAAESIGRNLMRIVDWMPFLYAIGIVSAFCTKGNKRLGDLVVGSLVVRETSLSDLKPTWETAPGGTASAGLLGAAQLSPEEFALIDSFLSRRSALDYHIRAHMADEVFRRIQTKLKIPDENIRMASKEKLLEALAYERRSTANFS
jgi:uncharacterized RDD family membrane protein YckC